MSPDGVHEAELERGLSRRQLIRAAAAAGAAAWSAPVIIDSLSSPAAAASGTCHKYSVKLEPGGGAFLQCFGGTSAICFPASDTRWGASGSAPSSCANVCNSNPTTGASAAGTHNYLPGLGTTTLGSGVDRTTYYVVKFDNPLAGNTTCGFQSLANGGTDWMVGGRYGPGDPGSQFIKIDTSTAVAASGPTAPAVGGYNAATNTAWVRAAYSGGTNMNATDALSYVYVKYCCSKAS